MFLHGESISVLNSLWVLTSRLGGPGSGADDKDRSFFNPEKYKVRTYPAVDTPGATIPTWLGLQIVLFDQRGSGKSTP